MTKLVKLKSNSAVKKPAPSLAGSGMLDMPLGPPEGAPTGATGGGGGGGVLPAPGAGEGGGLLGGGTLWGTPELLGIGVVGSPPAGRLKDGCSGGF
ncbi:hypothetical protein GCM10009721_18910 [Terrabacter tumescens]|uniref:Uncharacterized protein n=1 Tax=Terrabacter tumescens TaxID=60443 RepID=A0ABQ2HZZ0_9MICO|nr:hypothetical protein GCM10009721_18910 [Terrabacter tumescens]